MPPPERSTTRIFPLPTPTLYEANGPGATDNEHVGHAVLALARDAFTRLARAGGFRLTPVRRLGRLLLFHRLAIEAELRQTRRRADFFWREAIRQLEKIWNDDTVWREAAGEGAVIGDGLLDAVLRELFADTHWGFYQTHRGIRHNAPAGQRLAQ